MSVETLTLIGDTAEYFIWHNIFYLLLNGGSRPADSNAIENKAFINWHSPCILVHNLVQKMKPS